LPPMDGVPYPEAVSAFVRVQTVRQTDRPLAHCGQSDRQEKDYVDVDAVLTITHRAILSLRSKGHSALRRTKRSEKISLYQVIGGLRRVDGLPPFDPGKRRADSAESRRVVRLLLREKKLLAETLGDAHPLERGLKLGANPCKVYDQTLFPSLS
jgi:hypothetical protein